MDNETSKKDNPVGSGNWWLECFERLASRFGVVSAFGFLAYLFVIFSASADQKQRIIEMYVLGNGIYSQYVNALITAVFIALWTAQNVYYRRQIEQHKAEIARIGGEKSALQQRLLQELSKQYQLYALRDELRAMAADDPEIAQGWLFSFLDSNYSRAISVLPTLTLWKIIRVQITRSMDSRYAEAMHRLDHELGLPKNKVYEKSIHRYNKVIGDVLWHRHYLLVHIVSALTRTSRTVSVWVAKRKQGALQIVQVDPEFSTLVEYA